MADKIKNFFMRKKADKRFKQAGSGRKLNDATPQNAKQTTSQYVPPPRQDMTEERRLAAQAALMRLQEDKKKENPTFNTSISAIRARAKKELEMENRKLQEAAEAAAKDEAPSASKPNELSPHLAVNGVYFKCSMINNEVLSKDEWKTAIRQFLYEQLADEQGLTACLIIQSCNSGRERIETCVETLCKYLENIIAHPDEEKYHKIRMSNKNFNERVQGIEGSLELLNAAGFREQDIETNGNIEKFLVFNVANIDSIDTLTVLIDALRSAEPIALELDRNRQVLLPSQATSKTELPQSFYTISAEEFKKEQQLRAEVLEKQLMLRTKAMREKDEMRELKKYKYTLLRIRFPDDVFLQGTFSVYDKISDLYEFVKDSLEHEGLPFVLKGPDGTVLTEDDGEKPLIDFKLVPAVILTFNWHSSIHDEVNRLSNPIDFLKKELMLLLDR